MLPLQQPAQKREPPALECGFQLTTRKTVNLDEHQPRFICRAFRDRQTQQPDGPFAAADGATQPTKKMSDASDHPAFSWLSPVRASMAAPAFCAIKAHSSSRRLSKGPKVSCAVCA